jgi:hypothetical protein
VEIAVRMHVDGLDSLAVDRNGELLPHRLLGVRAVQETAAAKEDAGSRSSAGFQKITARRHHSFLHGFFGLHDL